MKNKKVLLAILALIVVVLIVGFATNWFSGKKEEKLTLIPLSPDIVRPMLTT